ncbi:T-cell surface glycoprotein CD3 delta chain [Mus caroli]|uniref:T-cell surface glycoprotein CD3 delta chain n=1 Tax=Mus caroli TaxID=10089 RepID=A0A6P5Q842_MUSCR|nr:T-cell surface glycoprotein CD3 delta chain [Mus caroli]
MEHGGILASLILATVLPQGSPFKIPVTEYEDKVFVSCNTSVMHLDGTVEGWFAKNKTLNLGKGILDPRGMYLCNGTEQLAKEVSTVQVHYRMCQNCVELDSGTMAGVIIIDLIATLLLALGVYCFAGHETGRPSGAAEVQALLKNEQLYQPLRDREDAQYSRLGGNWPRNKRS